MTPAKYARVLNAARALLISMTSRSATSLNVSRSRRSVPRKPPDRAAGPPVRNRPPNCPPEPHMPVGLLTLELHIPDAQSLKDKRRVFHSLKDKLRGGVKMGGGGAGEHKGGEGAGVGNGSGSEEGK